MGSLKKEWYFPRTLLVLEKQVDQLDLKAD